MTKCLSTLCGVENPEGRQYCVKCGVELSLPVNEVRNRDIIYQAFLEAVKEHPEMKAGNINRSVFEYSLEKSAGQLFATAVEAGARNSSKLSEKTKEMDILEIEKEKLKILKGISKNLKGMNKKRK